MRNIAIISTDWHIDAGNVELSKNLAAQQILLAKKKGVKLLLCLGDIFDSKKAQPELVLNCFKEILDKVQDEGMELWSIAGNHDKTDPYSWSSYLRPFAEHPALHYIEKQEVVQWDKNVWVFQSYIKEPLWVENLLKTLSEYGPYDKPMYLFSHQAMNGSRNNDGSTMVSSINQKLLLPFEKCFFGHYHDAQQPLPNAYHLSAWKQKNFGENANKGFYVLQEDENGILNVEFCKSEFPEFETLEVEASALTPEACKKLIEEIGTVKECSVRLAVTGTTDELKALPTKQLNEAGIKIKTIDTLEKTMVEEGVQVEDYEKDETLVDAFKAFCMEKEYDFEEGLEYLKLALCN